MVKRKSGKLPPTKSQKKAMRRAGKVLKRNVPKGIMREAWDTKLTGIQNLSRVGLAASVNVLPSLKRPATRNRPPVASLADVDNSAELTASSMSRPDVLSAIEKEASRPEKIAKAVVRPGEDLALGRMIAAHGDDYVSMARDIKLNYLQWTPAQLRRKCERRRKILAQG